jgi:hypothetical protein
MMTSSSSRAGRPIGFFIPTPNAQDGGVGLSIHQAPFDLIAEAFVCALPYQVPVADGFLLPGQPELNRNHVAQVMKLK